MNITAFSMTPLFEDRVMGGAQKQLYVVIMHLAEQGHNITVLCTRRDPDATEAFQWHENARVLPIFRFKQPYPEPYATPIYNIASAIQDIGEHLAEADVFYSHDGGFIFPYIYQTVPTVVSLRSVLFAETLQSAYLFQGDDLILISNYQRDVILNTVGRFFPDLAARTHVIYNGLDFDTFRPSPTDSIRQRIPQVNPDEHAIALYPHRPERGKGILEVIEAANLLVHQHGITNLRVLVPRWIESALSPGDKAFYEDVTGRMEHYGLTENFVFHDWVSQSLMPQYYSMGAVTFAIGSYVETFGNVPYESLACGTPSIVARVGPARELLPEGLIEKVDYGDVQSAAAIAARIIKNGERTPPATLTDLQTRFQRADMVEAYAHIILNAKKRPLMPYIHRPLTPQTQFVQSPWVYAANGRQYHDFTEQYRSDADIARDDVMNLYRDGWLVPVRA
ncbi:MAG: glycosyltransferase family 4 protein [Chloroflexota bacterium]